MRDVATLAGVSLMTVSRAVSGAPAVSPDTRERVLRAASALNFIPNKAAQCLASNRSVTFYLLANNRGDSLTRNIIIGAMSECDARSAMLLVHETENPISRVQAIIAAKPAGVVLCELKENVHDIATSLRRARIGVVVTGTRRQPGKWSNIFADDRDAVDHLAQHLFSIGRREYLYIGDTSDPDRTRHHESILRPALAKLGRHQFRTALLSRDQPQQAFDRIYNALSSGARPDVVIGATNSLSLAAITAAYRLGVSVPQDMAVCSLGDDYRHLDFWPAMTATRVPAERLGRAAITSLIKVFAKEGARLAGAGSALGLPYELLLQEAAPVAGPGEP